MKKSKVAPDHGLEKLAGTLKKVSGIELSEKLPLWSQICVAFEVRHLVEHLDGRVDAKFLRKVQKFWENSIWGKRSPSLDRLKRITVEEGDIESTYRAMREAASLLTDALVQWDTDRNQCKSQSDEAAANGKSA